MNTAALVKAAKSPAGALLIGFLTREIAAVAGFTVRAVVKGVIRHSVVAQRSIKTMLEEVKAEIHDIAEEAIKDVDEAEQKLSGDHGSDAGTTTTAPV